MPNTRKILPGAAAVLAAFNLLFFYSMKDAWGGIATIVRVPGFSVYILALLAVMAAAALVGAFAGFPRWASRALLGLSALFTAALAYVCAVDIGSWNYILREFGYALLWTAAVAAFGLLLFAYPKSALARSKAFRLCALVVGAAALFAASFDLSFTRFGEGPVVWAVGEDYQIVFTTSCRATASVEVGGVAYRDTYSGYDVSETRVHKVSVPMAALDAAKSYTIGARAMILRGPYWAIQGRSISRKYAFRPVDPSDGLQYYSLSDPHGFVAPAVGASGWFGDKLDFLIVAGDTSSFLDRPADLDRVLAIAYGATKGRLPVVYARGNHETKGRVSNSLHRYVGADGDKFYYSFRLGPVWGLVLDLGEDHWDGWQEFYGAARFDAYRAEQTRFLDGIVADAAREYGAPGVAYRLAVCHIPVTFEYADDEHAPVAFQKAWIERLDRMGIDLMVNGHRHEAMYVSLDLPAGLPLSKSAALTGKKKNRVDGMRLESNFPAVIDSRRSELQTETVDEDLFGRRFFGLAVEVKGEGMELRYTDERGKVLRTVGAWTGADLGEVIRVPCFSARRGTEKAQI